MSVEQGYLADRVETYYQLITERYKFYLGQMYYRGDKPAFTQVLDQRLEFLKLQEAKTKAESGVTDAEAAFWMGNRDGAQERYAELAARYSDEVKNA